MTTPSRVGGGKAIEVANASAVLNTNTFDTTGANRGIFAIILAGAATPVLPTSVVYDPAGANQALTLIQQVTFNTNWIAATYGRLGPTSGSAKLVRATWAAAPDEGLLIAESIQDMDQATGWRTPNTPGAGSANTNPVTATLAATSVSGDLVLGLMAASSALTIVATLSSATVTIHDKLEGADGTGNEGLSAGSVVASGVSTTVSADIVNTSPGGASVIFWEQFALSLIPVAGGSAPVADFSQFPKNPIQSYARGYQ